MIRTMRNYFGARAGYGSCPNCGDSWGWKQSSALTYKEIRTEAQVTTDGQTVTRTVPAAKEVMLCTECMNNPGSLNLEKIKKSLIVSGWEQEDANLAADSVRKFKNGEGNMKQ